ncbi:MAG: cell division protein ZapA [Candidatus Krumholzibacteria bacterium]|jgi:cell division protein ZapA|nr:cell division protein ZapA [Candidatus Krumholzibacteria bacterium]
MPEQHDVTVSIFGREYTLRSDVDPEWVRVLAQQIDQRMRDAAAGGGPLGADRLAILVALNLADDLLKAQQSGPDELASLRDGLDRLTTILAEEVGKEGVRGV